MSNSTMTQPLITNLIATFYGQAGHMDDLYQQLSEALIPLEVRQRIPQAMPLPTDWTIELETTPFLYRHRPAGHTDTEFIQLALDCQLSPVDQAWLTMRQQLETALPLGITNLAGVLGYSLIYSADVAPNNPTPEQFQAMQQAARPLHYDLPEFEFVVPTSVGSEPTERSHKASFVTPNPAGQLPERSHKASFVTPNPAGQLWLMDLPLHGEAATIYMALSQEADFFKNTLYGPAAYLLEPDLIAHKAYFHIRQFPAKEQKPKFSAKLERLSQATDNLLQKIAQNQITGSLVSEINQLAKEYSGLGQLLRDLSRLQVSLREQIYNYDRLKIPASDDILQLHRGYMTTNLRQFELLVVEGQAIQTATNTAIQMAQTRLSETQNILSKKQATKQELTQNILAVLGAALAIPQLVDRDGAAALLNRLAGVTMDNESTAGILILMAVQSLIAGLCAWVVVQFLNRDRTE